MTANEGTIGIGEPCTKDWVCIFRYLSRRVMGDSYGVNSIVIFWISRRFVFRDDEMGKCIAVKLILTSSYSLVNEVMRFTGRSMYLIFRAYVLARYPSAGAFRTTFNDVIVFWTRTLRVLNVDRRVNAIFNVFVGVAFYYIVPDSVVIFNVLKCVAWDNYSRF